MLRDKDLRVLNLVVESYVQTGRPVSSGFIVQAKRFEGSPATVRNIMAKLEELGLLVQPHTSAGRIPTDRGLRRYVDTLLTGIPYLREEGAFIQEDFPTRTVDMDSLLIQASRILADGSDSLGFVIPPHISHVNFEHIRFIKISGSKIMTVLVTPFQMVMTEILDTALPFTQSELDRATQYINRNFRGKNLLFVRDYMLQELPKFRLKYENVINKLIDLVEAYTNPPEGENRIYIEGKSRLLEKAELFDMNKLKSLFQSFEETANLVRLLSDFISLDRVKVLIGSEVNSPDIMDCSLILSHYGYGNQVLGSLGIIGPKRIAYEKIIPLVDRVAKRLSRAIMVSGKEVSL